jgi:hypothetical protein
MDITQLSPCLTIGSVIAILCDTGVLGLRWAELTPALFLIFISTTLFCRCVPPLAHDVPRLRPHQRLRPTRSDAPRLQPQSFPCHPSYLVLHTHFDTCRLCRSLQPLAAS